jgi:hypothetical protein
MIRSEAWRRTLVVVALTAALLTTIAAGRAFAAGARASASARTATPSLPGLPPAPGIGFPAAPPAGAIPGPGTAGASIKIPTHISTPGLLSGAAIIRGRQLTLTIACPTDGRASVTDASIGRQTLARTTYRCASNRAAVTFKLGASAAGRLRALRSSVGTITIGRGAATGTFTLTLATAPARGAFWGQDGGLQCNLLGRRTAFLVAPNFTVTPNAVIDVRPWVAFFTAAHGWQWLGTGGLNRSSWYQWTASPIGVLQWRTSAGALNRWTWAPITVAGAQPTLMIAGFEVEYLYAHPQYTWRFAASQPATGPAATFCSYG